MNKDPLIIILIRYKYLFGISVLVIMINVFLFFSIIKEQEKTILGLQEKYSSIRRMNTSPAGTNSKAEYYFKIKEAIVFFYKMLPSMNSVSDRIITLNEVLGKYKLPPEKIVFTPDKDKKNGLWKYSTSFTVRGQYSSVKSLLAEIQNLPGLFCINNISLKHSKDNRNIDMTLHIATYCK